MDEAGSDWAASQAVLWGLSPSMHAGRSTSVHRFSYQPREPSRGRAGSDGVRDSVARYLQRDFCPMGGGEATAPADAAMLGGGGGFAPSDGDAHDSCPSRACASARRLAEGLAYSPFTEPSAQSPSAQPPSAQPPSAQPPSAQPPPAQLASPPPPPRRPLIGAFDSNWEEAQKEAQRGTQGETLPTVGPKFSPSVAEGSAGSAGSADCEGHARMNAQSVAPRAPNASPWVAGGAAASAPPKLAAIPMGIAAIAEPMALAAAGAISDGEIFEIELG